MIPYLNASLGGHAFTKEPLSVTFKVQGKLITVHPTKIAVNALKDKNEAAKIVEWLVRKINSAWDNRHNIEPRFESMPTPKIVGILKLLPKTNRRECGQATCMVFATLMADRAKGYEDCLQLNDSNRIKLSEYLSQFCFD